jgi:hypothetical protein
MAKNRNGRSEHVRLGLGSMIMATVFTVFAVNSGMRAYEQGRKALGYTNKACGGNRRRSRSRSKK